MTRKEVAYANASGQPPLANHYDPFARGRQPVGVRTINPTDTTNNRRFPVEIWYPAAPEYAGDDIAPESQDAFIPPRSEEPRRQMAVRDAMPNSGTYPLILYSHPSGGHRRAATFLCTHLCSHGFVVAALDHSEVVAPELAKKADETEQQKHARWDAVIASRVPDVRFLLELLREGQDWKSEVKLDFARIGIVGHSFGAWTALAINDVEPGIGAVVALAPGGASNPRPGILPVKLEFKWSHDVPTLYLVAENDVSLPLSGMYEIFDRTPATKRMVILRRADHLHFMDNVDEIHEQVRKMPVPPELEWMQKEMLPISELYSGEQANLFVRGLTLCHFDAALNGNAEATGFLSGDIEAGLARRGVEIILRRP